MRKALELSVGDLRGKRSRSEVQAVVEELKEALGRYVFLIGLWEERRLIRLGLVGYDKTPARRS